MWPPITGTLYSNSCRIVCCDDCAAQYFRNEDFISLSLWFSQTGISATKSNEITTVLVVKNSMTLVKLKCLHKNSSLVPIIHASGILDEMEIKMMNDSLDKKKMSKSKTPPPSLKPISEENKSLKLWLTQSGFANYLVDKFAMTLTKMDLQYSDERWSTTMNGYKGIDDDDKTLICNALENTMSKNDE
jgi:hypothetical protein